MKKQIKISLVASALLLSTLNGQSLGHISVTSATKLQQSIKDVTSNVDVITQVELKEKHFVSVKAALNSIAGLSFTSNGGLGSNSSVNLRGAGNNRTLVLIDGIRYQDPSSTSGANISHLMIEDVQRIEVIKGAQSGVWGADATAGVVNIITKKATEGTNGSINASYGSFNTKQYGATVSHKTKEFDVQATSNKITSNGFTVQAPKNKDIDNYEDDAYVNTTLNLKSNYYINDDSSLFLNITNIDALKEYDSFNNPDDTVMKSDVSNRLYNVSFSQKFNNHNIKVSVEKSKFSRDEIGTVAKYGNEYVKIFNGEHNNLEISDNIKYNKNDFVLVGIGTSSDDVNYILTDNNKKQKENKNNSLYVTNSNTFDKTIFTQSVRYDDYDNFSSKSTGKLGIKHNINKDTFITSNIGTAYNVPSIVQELNPWGAVNSDLNSENSKSSDISINYKSLKATYFYNKVTDLIEWFDEDGFGGNPAIYKNLDGKSTFKGFEVEYNKAIYDEALLNLSYTKLSAKDKDGKDLTRKVKDNLKLSVDYYGISNYHINLNGEYVGDRFDDSAKLKSTGNYTVWNFISNYDWDNKNTTFIKIDNLTDKYFQTVDGYTTSPRAFYIGHKIDF